MPSKKGRPEPRWLVILEDIRSQNRSTLEAVEASRVALEGRLDVLDAEVRARFAVVEAAVRNLGQDTRELKQESRDLRADLTRFDQESRARDTSLEVALRELKVNVQENSVDIRDLAAKVEALSRLEARVSALERRGA
jgi:chromosome segregation ATPase